MNMLELKFRFFKKMKYQIEKERGSIQVFLYWWKKYYFLPSFFFWWNKNKTYRRMKLLLQTKKKKQILCFIVSTSILNISLQIWQITIKREKRKETNRWNFWFNFFHSFFLCFKLLHYNEWMKKIVRTDGEKK